MSKEKAKGKREENQVPASQSKEERGLRHQEGPSCPTPRMVDRFVSSTTTKQVAVTASVTGFMFARYVVVESQDMGQWIARSESRYERQF